MYCIHVIIVSHIFSYILKYSKLNLNISIQNIHTPMQTHTHLIMKSYSFCIHNSYIIITYGFSTLICFVYKWEISSLRSLTVLIEFHVI